MRFSRCNPEGTYVAGLLITLLLGLSIVASALPQPQLDDETLTFLQKVDRRLWQHEKLSFRPFAVGSKASSKFFEGLNMESSPDLKRIVVFGKGDLQGLSTLMHVAYTIGSSEGFLALGSAARSSLESLAQLPQVVKVYPDIRINFNYTTSMVQNRIVETDLSRVREIIGAARVENDFKLDGRGSVIAIADTGTDFGVPDLRDAVARDSNGKPLQLDADGQGIVLTPIVFAANITLTTTTPRRYSISSWKGPTPEDSNSTIYVNSKGVFLNISRQGQGLKVPIYNSIYPFWSPLILKPTAVADWMIGDNSSSFIVSKSGRYRFGFIFNPLDSGFYATLVVDSKTPGVYDTVYVDISTTYAYFLEALWFYGLLPPGVKLIPPDFSFYDEEQHRVGDGTEVLARDFTGDGVPDVSLGLLGARVLDIWGAVGMGLSEQPTSLPLAFYGAYNGTLLPSMDPKGRFFSVMNDFHGHGTMTAATASGRGIAKYDLYGNKTYLNVKGVSPGASIMALKILWWGDALYGYMWASGFDFDDRNKTWLYTGEHKADVISSSWGVQLTPILLSAPGYDVLSILQATLSIPSHLDPKFPGIVFVNSAGNSGYGYGTIDSPSASSFAITVGASTSNHHVGADFTKGEPRYGRAAAYADDIVDFSSRGPSPIGEAKPDLLNVGAWGFTPLPPLYGLGNGSLAFTLFGGTSMSTALTSGAVALLVQALKEAGRRPDPFLVKNILMSTAKDTFNDPFTQGSGRVDVFKAVSYALANKSSSKSIFIAYTNATYISIAQLLNPIISSYNYTETHVNIKPLSVKPQPMSKWFAGIVPAGGRSEAVFTVSNPFNTTIEATAGATVLQLIKKVTFRNKTEPLKVDPLLKDDGGHRPKYFNLTEMVGVFPVDTELLVVKLVVPFTTFHNTSISRFYGEALTIASLYLYDWKDANHDGKVWYNETRLVNRGGVWGTIQEVRVGEPLSKIRGTPLLGVYHVPEYFSRYGWPIGRNVTAINFTATIYFYKKASWSWITIDKPRLILENSSTTTFTATLNVPETASPGVYQAYITVNGSNGQIMNLPFSVIVPIEESGKNKPYVFAGKRTNDASLYDNGAIYGAFDFFGRYVSGEWRIYAFKVRDETINTANIRLVWSSPHTSLDIFVISPRGSYIATSVPPGAYFIIDLWPSNDYLGNGAFYPSQNAGSNATVLQVPINQTGIYLINIHNTLFGGEASEEVFIGQLSFTTLLPDVTPPKLTLTQPPRFVRRILYVIFESLDENPSETKYSLDGGLYINVTGKSIIEIDTSKLLDGPHHITIMSRDKVGHETSKTVTFNSDNTEPSAYIITPEEGAILSRNTTIKFTAFDTNMAQLTLTIAGRSIDVMGRDTYTWDTTSVGDGEYSISISASDDVGNLKRQSMKVLVDNTPPKVEIITPLSGSVLNGTVEILFTTQDPLLEKVSLSIDGSPIDVLGWSRYVWNTSYLGDGEHILKLKAVDKAGNSAEAKVVVSTINVQLTLERTAKEASEAGFRYGTTLTGAVCVFAVIAIGSAVWLTNRRQRSKTGSNKVYRFHIAPTGKRSLVFHSDTGK